MKKWINKMKVAMFLLGVLALTDIANAQLDLAGEDIFYASSTNSGITNLFVNTDGLISLQNVNYDISSSGSGTTILIAPDRKGTLYSGGNSVTQMAFQVDNQSGLFNGYSLTANDYIFIADSSTNNAGTQLRRISNVGAVTTNAAPLIDGQTNYVFSRTIQYAGAASAASNDTVWVASAASRVITRTITASAFNQLYQGAGAYDAPLALGLSSTGVYTIAVSGKIQVYK